jgi:hypothetical protein
MFFNQNKKAVRIVSGVIIGIIVFAMLATMLVYI